MKLRSVVSVAALSAAGVLLLAQSVLAEVRITGSGASFPAPIYTTWFKEFSRANKFFGSFFGSGLTL